jgi:hypothetical protein
MNWIVLLLAFFLIVGFLPPGRMGSVYVSVLVGSAAVLAVVFIGLGT